jgi:heterodisulfide reductase subunit B
MQYALFLGCKIPHFVPHYEKSARRVLAELNVDLVEPEFNCCGYPMRHLYFDSYLLANARNMAIAEAMGLDMLTPCKCCFGSFMRVRHLLEEFPALKEKVDQGLAEEGLKYTGGNEVKHLLTVLHDDVGLDALAAKVTSPYKGLKIAPMYGCHAIRPSKMTHFDDPAAPSIVDELLKVTGADTVDWDGKLGCCGSPVRAFNEQLSLDMVSKLLREARRGGADILCISCPYSQMQCEWAEEVTSGADKAEFVGGAMLYPQILGLTMGFTPEELGLQYNLPDVSFILSFLEEESKAATG